MYKGIVAIASVLALISLASLAQAGNGAQGTPQKYSNADRSHHSQINEFSSSSAAAHARR
jgi:hypothetical protein